MDARKFDALTRMLARVGTRRQVVAGAAAVAVGGIEAADAHKRKSCRAGRQTCQRDNQCCSGTCRRGVEVPLKDRNRCACRDGETQCGNACVDLAHDERNCGACGTRCRTGDLCCPDGCVDTTTDEENCGACGNICGDGDVCCGGTCAALDSNADNCGACGHACAEGVPCISGACANAALCFAAWTGESTYCVVSTEADAYIDGRIVVSGSDDDERSFCTRSADCQDAPICSISGVECVCVTDDVWGPNPGDTSHFSPSICHAVVTAPACLAEAADLAPFTRCNETVDFGVWGTYEEDTALGTTACFSSDECNGDWDPMCDNPEFECWCVFSYSAVPATSVSMFARPLCYRDRVTRP